jgi:hypothetical protein
MRTCTKCLQSLPLTEFYKDRRRKDGLQARCRRCYKAYNRERNAKDPQANTQWQREYHKKFPELTHRQRLRRQYGISLETYNMMIKAQCAACAICKSTDPGGRGYWHVDHDHQTGLIRGLLCHFCNTGIGLLGEDPVRMARAIDYVRGNHANIIGSVRTSRGWRAVT